MNDFAQVQSIEEGQTSISNRKYNLQDGLEAVITATKARLAQSSGPVFIGVAGASASGKTSMVANKIVAEFAGQVELISLDNYMKGDHYLTKCEEKGTPINWDHPDFVHLELIAEHIKTLRQGKSIDRPTYSFPEARCIGHKTIEPTSLVVIEGIYALEQTVADNLDLKVFVETSTHGRIIRRLMRDVVERGLKPEPNLIFMARDVEPMYSEYVEPTKDCANFIILNDYTAQTEAKRAQVAQCQVKYPTTLTEEQLRSAGASRLARVEQKDIFFSPKENGFSTGELIRLRQEGDYLTICYKGPVSDQLHRVNAKFEFKIDEAVVESLTKLYKQGDLTLEKTRDIWVLPNGTVVSCDTNIRLSRAGTQEQIDSESQSWVELQLPLSNEGHPQNTQVQAEIDLNLDPNLAFKNTYDEIFGLAK